MLFNLCRSWTLNSDSKPSPPPNTQHLEQGTFRPILHIQSILDRLIYNDEIENIDSNIPVMLKQENVVT